MSDSSATKLWVSAAADMSSPIGVSFTSCSLLGRRPFAHDTGHRGSRQPSKCRKRQTGESCDGSITGNLCPSEIDFLLPKVFGNSKTTLQGVYPENGLRPFWAVVQKANETYPLTYESSFTYNSLYVNRFRLSGRPAQPLVWQFDVLGTHEDPDATPLTSTIAACEAFYLMSDVVFTYNATVYKLLSFDLTVDNRINARRQNELRPSMFEAQDSDVTLNMQIAYREDTEALYRASMDGAAASLLLDNIPIASTLVKYLFAFNNLAIPEGGPTIPASGPVDQNFTMKAYRDSTGAVVPVTASQNQVLITKTVT